MLKEIGRVSEETKGGGTPIRSDAPLTPPKKP